MNGPIIRRVDDAEYVLEHPDGEEIDRYQQETMHHPDDWIDAANDAGYDTWALVRGNYDFLDDR